MTKRADAPALTPSKRIALTGWKPHELYIVFSGEKRDPLAKNVEAVQAKIVVSKLGVDRATGSLHAER